MLTRSQMALLCLGLFLALALCGAWQTFTWGRTIDLGAGKGRNWWCVLYPGLCRSACGSYAQPAENDLVCGEYILRLRLVEWVQQRTARREDVVLLG